MEKTLKAIINANVRNIELIGYFKRSTQKIPVFLGSINRKFPEIRDLLEKELIKDHKAIKSYIFNLDKFENFFYENYQEKIDFLKVEIWSKKRKKLELIELTENITPEEGCEDYDEKLRVCLEFAKKSIGELDTMEIEKEDKNNIVGEIQKKMKNDPIHNFLIFIRSDRDIVFNKRTEDIDGIVHKKVLNYLNRCTQGKGWALFTKLKNDGFFKEYSPAKSYSITKLGLLVDAKLKGLQWEQEDSFQKSKEEIAQEEEFNELQKSFGF
ncbi:hypothetical protein LCGC14_1082030 [marine sediment metagenome]|uniref:Uncharacterized protein n=1 Tax=marine sediment metagenome TaxID=412755 RepID=A0A0F9N2K5_9ZZZZ|nr:MAG: hypothetical protein Lokiarch_22560 [Candidatus Lokiarchaeum sp. GC14_75]